MANQTVADNPGLLGKTGLAVGPYRSLSAPLFDALAVQSPLGSQVYAPVWADWPALANQVGEKTKLATGKMTIARIDLTPTSPGFTLDVSLQDLTFIGDSLRRRLRAVAPRWCTRPCRRATSSGARCQRYGRR